MIKLMSQLRELRQQLAQLMAKVAHTAAIVQRWNLQFENQQRHDNREHSVTEGFNPVESQLALRKTFEKLHDFNFDRTYAAAEIFFAKYAEK
jgi:hypothetical protein